MQKLWVKIAVAVAALVVLAAVLIPFLINADTFRPKVEDQLSSALGRKVTLGNLSFSLFSGSLDAENISIAEDPAFGTAPFLAAKSLKIGVETGALLFHRELHITKLTIDTPAIQLIHAQNGAPNGKWNFSSLGGAAPAHASSAGQQPGALPDLTVGELRIKDGSATVSSVPAKGKPFVYSEINQTIQRLSFAKSFPFQVSANLPGSGSFQLTGNAGPISQKDAADTPFSATMALKNFDPVAAGVIDGGQGISMVLDIDTQLASDGATLTNNGKLEATKLQLARSGSPAPQPVKMDYAVTHHLEERKGEVSDLSIHAGSVAAHVTGSYDAAGDGVALDLHLSAPDLPIDQVEKLLPAFGVRLPTGSGLKGGALKASLAITGPATSPMIAGPVEIDNTQLEGFDLGSKIQNMNPFGTKGGGTAIQTLRANVKNDSQATQLTDIYVVIEKIGTATGTGTVTAGGNLDFKMVAKLSAISGATAATGKAVSEVTGQATSLLGGFMGKGKAANAKNTSTKSGNGGGIPITITGTTADPIIHANPLGMFK